jgi:hypothetical protein
VVYFTSRALYLREITPAPVDEETGTTTQSDWTFSRIQYIDKIFK